MRGFRRFGLYVLVAIIFTASHAWAVPFTGAMEGFWTVDFISGPDGTFSHTAGATTFRGYTTTGGAMTCHSIQVFKTVQEPTGACSANEFGSVVTNHYHCQFEGTEDIFHSIGTSRGCFPSSCLDENRTFQVGCLFTFTESVTAVGGTGIAVGSSGSWTISGVGRYTQAGVTEPDGLLVFAGTTSAEIEGDFELADGSVALDGAVLEIPSPGAKVSGVTLISGWSCLGGELEVEFSDADGVIETMTVVHGTERLDTETVCGDVHNGFSATYNWNRLGAGEKTARLIRNGEEVASHTFMVTAFDVEFVTEEGMCTIPDFPDAGKNATFVWEQSQQGLVLEAVN